MVVFWTGWNGVEISWGLGWLRRRWERDGGVLGQVERERQMMLSDIDHDYRRVCYLYLECDFGAKNWSLLVRYSRELGGKFNNTGHD